MGPLIDRGDSRFVIRRAFLSSRLEDREHMLRKSLKYADATPIGELAALLFIGVVAAAAKVSGFLLLLFPELGALAHCVITRPNHPWAKALWHLVVTPVATAMIGMLAMRYAGWTSYSVLAVIVLSLCVIAALRSPVLPALSAGILPLVLGVSDWTYPLAIFLSCTALATLCYVVRAGPVEEPVKPIGYSLLSGEPGELARLTLYLLFMTAATAAALFLHRPMLLFPPLAVLGFEVLVKPKGCSWGQRPIALIALFLTCAAGGAAAVAALGQSLPGLIVAMGIALAAVAWIDLYVPPAIAVSILPYATLTDGWAFPLEVGTSVAALVGLTLVCNRLEPFYLRFAKT